ncbi:rhomboid family intramembrane serine protease [Haloferula chungangensis]|uniref:Rhomboid family intramembrane serine protease n=1 Tax=Haloferula chungangensis TaxID=1048331 RepID=A0ABW2L9E4_9BACT
MSSHPREVLREQAALLGLIAFISMIFAWQELAGGEAYDPYMVVPQEIVSAWNEARNGSIHWREFLPLLSATFLHEGIDHLLFNMLFLWMFGALAVELIGSKWMLISYVFTALCGSILYVAMNAESPIPSLGASGAVMGFEGLYLAMAVRWQLPDPHIWPMARPVPPAQLAVLGIMGLAMDYMGFLGGNMGVAYSAHLGGFVGGLVLGSFVVPMPRVAHRR